MSDREMRALLQEVIDDIDSGRLIPWQKVRRKLKFLAPAAAAALISLSAGCISEYGAPEYAAPMVDAAVDAAYVLDAALDSGSVEDYGFQ